MGSKGNYKSSKIGAAGAQLLDLYVVVFSRKEAEMINPRTASYCTRKKKEGCRVSIDPDHVSIFWVIGASTACQLGYSGILGRTQRVRLGVTEQLYACSGRHSVPSTYFAGPGCIGRAFGWHQEHHRRMPLQIHERLSVCSYFQMSIYNRRAILLGRRRTAAIHCHLAEGV